MKIMNHGLQSLNENFSKKLNRNDTMSSTEGGVYSLCTWVFGT